MGSKKKARKRAKKAAKRAALFVEVAAPRRAPMPVAPPLAVPAVVTPAIVEASPPVDAPPVVDTPKAVASLATPSEAAVQAAGLLTDSLADAARVLGGVAEFWFRRPEQLVQAQTDWAKQMSDIWSNTVRRLGGDDLTPVIPRTGDKRFADAQWDQPLFDFMRQVHVASSAWAQDMLERNDDLAPRQKSKAGFYLRQIASAASPSNYPFTNPELLRETIDSGGENFARGLRMFAEDVGRGGGSLRLRQSDTGKLELGRDMAATPGKVVFCNDLIELIQYTPTTPDVFARPVLVVPPWINKFYILDLNPQKSLVRWMVAQSLTVFVISWVNPDARHADKGLSAYMHEGVLAALDAVGQATGAPDAHAIGYCVGGTMLAMTLAWMAAKGDARIASATFFAAQTDFSDPGDLAVFADEAAIESIERHMAQTGTLDGATMATAFNLMRPDDLFWSYFVNNYLRGREPPAFDLLAWNSDATRMTRACHSAYLRDCYLENKLSAGSLVLDEVPLDLRKITVPIYALATKEDHIAPARSVYHGMQFFGGPVRYVLGGSGHIAGVVNPPAAGKYQFWADGAEGALFDDWLASATETKGSWWPDWLAWMIGQTPDRVTPRIPGEGALAALCDAPGTYVHVRC